MKYVVGCLEGIESIVKEEIKEKVGVNAGVLVPGRLELNSQKLVELKSIHLIYELIDSFKFKSLNGILKKIENIKFSFIKKDFVVRCSRKGNHKFNSLHAEKKIGEIIFKKNHKVNLKSDMIIYVDIIGDLCLIGKLVGKNLNKRKYRLFRHNQSIDACLAYSVTQLTDSNSVYDPFCKDGVILIEAGLGGIKELYAQGSENSLRNTNINSRLAKITIKAEIPKSVDVVITLTKGISLSNIEKLFKIYKCIILVDINESIKKLANKNGYKLNKGLVIKDKKTIETGVFLA